MSRTTGVAVGLTAIAAAAFTGSHSLIARPGVAEGAHALALLGAIACNACGLVALACAAVYWTRGERTRGWLREDLGLVATHAHTAQVFALALGMVALSVLIDALMAAAAPTPSASIEATRRAAGTLANRERAHALAAMVALAGGALAPAIGEELFFRGWMLRAVRAAWGNAAAIGITSALFGWMHGDWLHAATAAVLGLFLGAVALATRSVWPAIACHTANNASAIAFAAGWLPPPAGRAALLACAVLASAAVGVLGVLARKRATRR